MKRLCNLLGPLGSGRAGSAAVRCDEHNSASTAPGSSGGGGGGVFRFPARTAGPMPHGRTQRPGSRQKRTSGNIPRRAEFSGETTTTPTAPGATAACFERRAVGEPSAADFRDFGFFDDTWSGHRKFGFALGSDMQEQILAFVYAEPWYLEAWNFVKGNEEAAEYSRYLRNFNEARYPLYFAELRGLAAGAGVPFDRIWVAVAQQELLGMQHTADVGRPRGCSDLMTADAICHNEDGSVDLLQQGKFVQFGFSKPDPTSGSPSSGGASRKTITTATRPSPTSATGFCYPGALPGWGPCWNTNGVAYSINFLFPESTVLTRGLVEPQVKGGAPEPSDEGREDGPAEVGLLPNCVSPFASCVALASRDYAFSESVHEPLTKVNADGFGLAFGQNLNIGSVDEDFVLSTEMGPGRYTNIAEVGQRRGSRLNRPLPIAVYNDNSRSNGASTHTPTPTQTQAPEQFSSHLFHGNRYNRDCGIEGGGQNQNGADASSSSAGKWPATTNPGPCKRTKQFEKLLKEKKDKESFATDEILETMSDETAPYPIFRTRPDGIVSLFTVCYEFLGRGGGSGRGDEAAGELWVRAWRHTGNSLGSGSGSGKAGLQDLPPVLEARVAAG